MIFPAKKTSVEFGDFHRFPVYLPLFTICFSHFPWISHSLRTFPMICFYIFPIFNLDFSSVPVCLFLRIFRGFPIVFAYFPWISHIFLTFPRVFLWISYGFPMVFLQVVQLPTSFPGLPARPGRTARMQRVPLRGQALRGEAAELCMLS